MALLPHASVTLAAALLLAGIALDPFQLHQLGLYLIYAVAGLGIVIAWGRCGFLPLGQALFIGLGGYLAGFTLKQFADDPWILALLLPICAVPSALLAWGVAALVFRRQLESGPYFSLITLALSILGYEIANGWTEVTGGFNGLGGIPSISGIARFDGFYFLVVAVLLAAFLATGRLVDSPLGTAWSAVAENEKRMRFLGFRTDSLKALAFGFSGLLAGTAGVLYAPHQGLVSPQLLGFALSAELVIWVAVGGRKLLAGAILGCAVVGGLGAELRHNTQYWEALVALLFIVVVLKFPGGLIQAAAALSPIKKRAQSTATVIKLPHFPRASGEQAKISYENVAASAGAARILNGVSFKAGGGVACLIGPNGAGKTSCFDATFGLLPRMSGIVRFHGVALGGKSPDMIARLGIGRKFQSPNVFNSLTVGENLMLPLLPRLPMSAWLNRGGFGMRSDALNLAAARFSFLNDEDVRAGALSQGRKQILELTMAMSATPSLALLDEPCAGLSREETRAATDLIREWGGQFGVSFLVIEHDMTLVREISDHVVVLHQGRVIAQGDYAAVRADPLVREVYSGGVK